MRNVGGVLEEMAQLGRTFRENAHKSQDIKSVIESTLSSTTWNGPAADRFRESWHQFSPSLHQLRDALNEAATEVDQRRDALDQATR
jgi:WXG100 family type VII secretion target